MAAAAAPPERFEDDKGSWVDVTEALKRNCASLSIGELRQTPDFNLYDSIAALELMDPKMDSGMNASAGQEDAVTSLEVAMAKGLLMDGLSGTQLIMVMDRLVCLLVAWLKGNSAVQTLFTCLYLHKVDAIKDPVLHPFCAALLKTVAHIKELVMMSDVAEEEDFSDSLFGFTLCEELKVDKALKGVVAAAKLVTAAPGGDAVVWAGAADGGAAVVAAIEARLHFVEILIRVLQSSSKIENNAKTPELCRKMQGVADAMLASATLAAADPLIGGVNPFEPFINSHLLAPTPPREIESFTVPEAVTFLNSEAGAIAVAAAVSKCSTLEELCDFYEEFDRCDPGLLARAKLHRLALGGEHVVGKVPMAELVCRSAEEFDALLPPATESAALGGDERVYASLIADVYTKGGALMYERLKLCGYNRARRRRKLTKFLPQVHTFWVQAFDTNAAIHALWAKNNTPLPSICHTVVPYATRICIAIAMRYVLSGFELDLFGPHEMHMAWWYLDYLCNCFERTHTAATERRGAAIDARARAGGGGGGGGKSKKGKKGKVKKGGGVKGPKSKGPLPEWELVSVMQNITRGLLRALDGCELDGRGPKLESEFTSMSILYEHRFGSLEALEQPQYVGYAVYAHSRGEVMAHVAKGELQTSSLFMVSFRYFETAAKKVEELLQGRSVPPGMKVQLTQLARVARGNMLSLKLSVMPGGLSTVRLDFDEHPCFPILKFR